MKKSDIHKINQYIVVAQTNTKKRNIKVTKNINQNVLATHTNLKFPQHFNMYQKYAESF